MLFNREAFVAGMACLALASPALAQDAASGGATPQTAVLVEIEDDGLMVEPFNVTVDELEDAAVYGANGERIGDVEDVLGTAEGEAMAVTVEVGGFLGIDDKDVIIMLDQIQADGLRLTIDMTREDLENLPDYDD